MNLFDVKSSDQGKLNLFLFITYQPNIEFLDRFIPSEPPSLFEKLRKSKLCIWLFLIV